MIYLWLTLVSIFLLIILIILRAFGKGMLAWWRSKWRRPTLAVEFSMAPPYCVKEPLEIYDDVSGNLLAVTDSYRVRFGVANRGRTTAANVRAYVKWIERETFSDGFVRIEKAMAPDLRWVGESSEGFFPGLFSGATALCKLGYTVNPAKKYWHYHESRESLGLGSGTTVFTLDTALSITGGAPDSLDSLIHPELNLVPGRYVIGVGVYGDNTRPIEVQFEVQLDGRWHDDEPAMWEGGLIVGMAT